MRGSRASRAASPIRLMLRMAIESSRPGQKISVGLSWKYCAALGHDVAPGRRLRRDAGAEEGEDRLGEDRGGADIGALHDQRRDRVRHQMPPHDLRQAGADRDRGLDIRLLARGQHDRAHQAGHARNFGDGDRDQHGPDAGAGQRHHGDREQDARHRHQAVHDAHQDGIDQLEEAGDEADRKADDDRQDRRADADQQRDAAAIDDARQQVAAIGVGAEQELRRGRLQPLRGRKLDRIMRRDQRRQDRDQHDQREQDRRRRDDRRRGEESETRPQRRRDRNGRLGKGYRPTFCCYPCLSTGSGDRAACRRRRSGD